MQLQYNEDRAKVQWMYLRVHFCIARENRKGEKFGVKGVHYVGVKVKV